MSEQPEEISAEDEIAEVIGRSVASRGMIMTDWVTVASVEGWEDDGEAVSQLFIFRSGSAWFRQMGLLREATVKTDSEYLREVDEG